MNSFVNYIIEAGISLGIFTLMYWFVLRGETRFNATRFYLLFALFFSTVLPFITISLQFTNHASVSKTITYVQPFKSNLLETVTVYASGFSAKMSNKILTFNYSMLIYQLGAIAAFFVIALGIFQLYKMVTSNRVFRLKGTRLVVSNKEISPYSFFNFIFIGKALTEQKNWKTMVYHELEHVKQGHSFDVLFVDLMMIFQWFNPFYWILRRLVRENHEFLADTSVISKGHITGGRYKELLLSQAIGGHPVMTSNFLNVKMIQKRFKMITNNKNKKYGFLKYAAGVTVALVLTLTFACEDVDKSLGTGIENNMIYMGKLTTEESVQEMGIKYLAVAEADQMDVLTLYPELKGQLTLENYKIAFNMEDQEQFKMMTKLKIKTINIDNKDINGKIPSALENPILGNDNKEVFIIVEDMPEFPGGELALRKFIADHIKYPATAEQKGIMGKVYVTFIVGADGAVQKARVARKVDPSLDEEALRVINSLPKWKPGKQRGVPVNVSYTVPINFQLQ